MVLVVVVSWHPSVGLSFPSSQQEERWVTWAEWNFAKKPRELREFSWSHWSLDIWPRAVEGFAGRFEISGWFQVATWQKGPNLSVEQLWILKFVGRIVGVWVQGMLEKSQCDLLHVKWPQAFLLQGSLMDNSAIHLSFYCELLSTFFFFKHIHTETHTQTYAYVMFLPCIQKKTFVGLVNW